MAVTATPYGNALLSMAAGNLNLSSSGTYKAALFTSSYAPNYDTQQFYGALTGEVSASGTNYSTGGNTITGLGLTYDGTTHRVVLAGGPVTFSGVSLTARYVVVYKSTGNANTSPLISYVDFGTDQTYSNEDLVVTFANGIIRLNVLVTSA